MPEDVSSVFCACAYTSFGNHVSALAHMHRRDRGRERRVGANLDSAPEYHYIASEHLRAPWYGPFSWPRGPWCTNVCK